MKAAQIAILIVLGALITPDLAGAVVTFDRLSDDTFIVSHRVKVKFWMGRGQAQRLVYEKAASLCVAAGFTHFEVRHQESQANQERETANASIRVRFFLQGGEERIECLPIANRKYVEQAAEKLDRGGYRQATRQR